MLLSLVAELTSYVRPDIGFLLDAAAQVLDGAKLYVDIVEINPPLIVVLNMPAVLVARALDVSPILAYRLGFATVLLGCLGIAGWYLRHALPSDGDCPVRWLLVVLLAFALFPLSAQDFGQREHLLLAVATPYLLLSVLRALDVPVRRDAAVATGLLASVGFALKPHFLPLFVAVEVYLLLAPGRGSERRPRRAPTPESLAVVTVLAAYGAAIVSLTPEYLRLVGMVARAYGRFLYNPFLQLLVTGPGAALSLFALLAFVALRRHAKHVALWDVIAIGALTCFLGGAVQQKGLRYHFYPSFALAVMLLGLVIVDVRTPIGRGVQRVYHILAQAVAAAIVVIVSVQCIGQIVGARRSDEAVQLRNIIDAVRARGTGGRVFVMSYHIGSTYPLVNYSGVPSASRFPQLWLLAAEYLDDLNADRPLRYRRPDEMSPAERFLNDAVRADLERHRPKVLLVLRHARDLPANGYRRLDYLAYFGRDPRIAGMLARYQHVADMGEYTVYERLADGRARTAPPPSTVPGTRDVARADREGLHLRLRDSTFVLAILVFATAVAVAARRERPGM